MRRKFGVVLLGLVVGGGVWVVLDSDIRHRLGRRVRQAAAHVVPGFAPAGPQTVTEVSAPAGERPAAPPVAWTARDWPGWRGPHGTNVVADDDAGAPPPAVWSDGENIRFRVPIAGSAHASPVVVGDKIVLACAEPGANGSAVVQSVRVLDRRTGEERWQREVNTGPAMPIHSKNSQASATPVTDGRRAYCVFQNADRVQTVALELADGKVAWDVTAGPHRSGFGLASSPVLFQGLLLLSVDGDGASFAAALDTADGKVVWRKSRPAGGSYGTPALWRGADGTTTLVRAGQKTATGYDPLTGAVRFTAEGPSSTSGNTPAVDAQRVYLSGGYPQKQTLALTPITTGGTAAPDWTEDRDSLVAYVPSPVAVGGTLVVLNDGGILAGLDGATGKRLWQKRLGGNFTASPLVVGTAVYCCDEEGTTHVLTLPSGKEKEPKVLGKNRLPEGMLASPVFADGVLYLRTTAALYAITAPPAN